MINLCYKKVNNFLRFKPAFIKGTITGILYLCISTETKVDENRLCLWDVLFSHSNGKEKINYIFTGCLASALVGEGHLPNSCCAKNFEMSRGVTKSLAYGWLKHVFTVR